MTSNTASQLRPFLAGVAAAYASILLFRLVRERHNSNLYRLDHEAASSTTTTSREVPASSPCVLPPQSAPSSGKKALMDSPTLDLRMIRKAEGAIRFRTSRLIIVVERCTNDHNYSAILRTAEALGVQRVWIIAPPMQSTVEGVAEVVDDDGGGGSGGAEVQGDSKLYRSTGQLVKSASASEARDRAMHHLFARKATEWLSVREFDDTASCLSALREEGYRVWATDLSQDAVPLTADDLTERAAAGGTGSASPLLPSKLAIAFGTEAVGCTAELLDGSDMRVYLPLRGFADSLNLSVATALVVHHLFLLDPTLVGAMEEEERVELRRKWYAKLCSQRLLSSKEKKERGRLNKHVRACEELERKRAAGERLHIEQQKKLENFEEYQSKLATMDRELQEKSRLAVEDLVQNPPDPLTDMRRADEHRTTFVGKRTKKRYGETWAEMPATANPKTPMIDDHASTSRFFRNKLQVSSDQPADLSEQESSDGQ